MEIRTDIPMVLASSIELRRGTPLDLGFEIHDINTRHLVFVVESTTSKTS